MVEAALTGPVAGDDTARAMDDPAVRPAAPDRSDRAYWIRVWVGGVVAYTVVAALTIAEGAYYFLNAGGKVAWRPLILGRCLDNYTCALFVPAFFWLVHRYPIDRRQWRRSVPLLFLASVTFVTIKLVALWPVNRALWDGPPTLFRPAQMANAISVLLDFWAVIGIAHAIEFYRRAQDRESTAARLRSELAHAQLDALRAQLHPHFLFNTLNGVATLMHRDASGADRMLTDLAELLRETLHHTGADEISLTEEMALLDRYLAIMRTRFGERLTVVCDIAPDVGDALLPHFVLQPLVENALEHGIAQRPGPGRVEIRADRDGPRLRITVADDGRGVQPPGAPIAGVGLANTRARLAQLYGDAQTLVLQPVAPAGTRATITLPYRVRSPVNAPLAAP